MLRLRISRTSSKPPRTIRRLTPTKLITFADQLAALSSTVSQGISSGAAQSPRADRHMTPSYKLRSEIDALLVSFSR